MRRELTSPSSGDTLVGALPVYSGGTGVNNAQAALEAMNGVSADQINVPGGILGLDSNNNVNPAVIGTVFQSGVAVTGPSSLAVSQSTTFTITNYDSFKTYYITPVSGTVTRSGETISYTAPPTIQAAGFTINGKTINIAIGAPNIQQPVINTPINGSSNLSSSVSFIAGAFAVSGGSDSHLSSDWQLATDSTFNTIVNSVTDSVANKTTWTVTGLLPTTTYYVRVRYKGNGFGYGPWSTSSTFSTASSFLPTTEEAKITPIYSAPDLQTPLLTSVVCNSNCSVIAIGYTIGNNTANGMSGVVYVFKRTGTAWTQVARLIPVDTSIKARRFGYSLAMTADGNKLIVGMPGAEYDQQPLSTFSTGSTSPGRVYVYDYSLSSLVWSLTQTLTGTSMADLFGQSVSVTPDGSFIAVGAPGNAATGDTSFNTYAEDKKGSVHIFVKSGVTYTLQNKHAPTTGKANGHNVCINDTGDVVTFLTPVSYYYQEMYGAADLQSYSITVLTRSGVTWTKESTLSITTNQDTNIKDSVSKPIYELSSDGNTLYVSRGELFQTNLPSNTYSNIDVYTRFNSVWSLTTTLTIDDALFSATDEKYISVNTANNILVVGYPSKAENGVSTSGNTYVFTKTGQSWNPLPQKLTRSEVLANATYGKKVKISKDSSRIVSLSNTGAFVYR